jgi:hypothetical protein
LATGRSWTFSDLTVRRIRVSRVEAEIIVAQINAVFNGWERDADATPGDPLLIDMVTLRCMSVRCCELAPRRILTHVQSDIRTAVLRAQMDDVLDHGSAIPQLILDFVANRIDKWQPRIKAGSGSTGASLPYRQEASLQLVLGQTRLWALALGLPHSGPGPAGVALLSSCWRAAIDSCEGIVQHAEAMRHLPASISVMLVYSALLALTVHRPLSTDVSPADRVARAATPL